MALGFAAFYPDGKVSPKIRFKLDKLSWRLGDLLHDSNSRCFCQQNVHSHVGTQRRSMADGFKSVQNTEFRKRMQSEFPWQPYCGPTRKPKLTSHGACSLQPAAGISKASYFLLFSLHISSDITFNKSRLTFTISPFPSSTLLFKKPFLINALGQDVVNDSGMIWKNSGQGQLLLCPLTLSFYS